MRVATSSLRRSFSTWKRSHLSLEVVRFASRSVMSNCCLFDEAVEENFSWDSRLMIFWCLVGIEEGGG